MRYPEKEGKYVKAEQGLQEKLQLILLASDVKFYKNLNAFFVMWNCKSYNKPLDMKLGKKDFICSGAKTAFFYQPLHFGPVFQNLMCSHLNAYAWDF